MHAASFLPSLIDAVGVYQNFHLNIYTSMSDKGLYDKLYDFIISLLFAAVLLSCIHIPS